MGAPQQSALGAGRLCCPREDILLLKRLSVADNGGCLNNGDQSKWQNGEAKK
ncbi:MAG: hypothetical protein Gyms2KO_28740 [Gymnodinialimonas sp.]